MKKFGDFETCLEETWAFMEVGRWCKEDKGDQLLFGMFYPCVMNYAFSCELLLKAIESYYSPDRHHSDQHNLDLLFDKLLRLPT